ncbi:UNVERIFIED_CONTAM: hypothetical protein NCL1_60770 [Trichonephila clavipes]
MITLMTSWKVWSYRWRGIRMPMSGRTQTTFVSALPVVT